MDYDGSFRPLCELLEDELHLPLPLANLVVQYALENELESFLSEYNFSEHLDNSQTNRILKFGSAFVARFLDGIANIVKSEKSRWLSEGRFKDFRVAILEKVEMILWYRLGLFGYDTPEVGTYYRSAFFPPLPADILGKFRDGRWFYYKDGHPHLYGHSGRTHDKWYYFVADSMQELLGLMDAEDVQAFLRHDTRWTPLNFERCQCHHCFLYWLQLSRLRGKYELHPRENPSASWRTNQGIKFSNGLECQSLRGECCHFCALLRRNEPEAVPTMMSEGADCLCIMKVGREMIKKYPRSRLSGVFTFLDIIDAFWARLRRLLETFGLPNDVAGLIADLVTGHEDALALRRDLLSHCDLDGLL